MSTLELRAKLAKAIEAATGGDCTVLYTAKGQATHMRKIKKFDLSTIDASMSGTHPAFIVDGVEKPAIYIGMYPGSVVNGELLSLPNTAPSTGLNYDNFISYAKANGNGHHLMTNAEWSALALLSYKNQTQPLGNTWWGQSVEDATQKGRRVDGLDTGILDATKVGATLTGSGPVSWRHNGKYTGVSDLAGNVFEFVTGLRTVKGEIQIMINNNAAILATDHSSTSASWKAIDGLTGDFITPDGNGTTTRSVKFATSGTADYTLVRSLDKFALLSNPSPINPVAAVALNKLKALGIFPMSSDQAVLGYDNIWVSTSLNCVAQRGGGYEHGLGGGIFSMSLERDRIWANVITGARPAFYEV